MATARCTRAGNGCPEPVYADMCFDALTGLEKVVAADSAAPVVATFPLQPDWRAKYSPDRDLVRSFEARIHSALKTPSTLFISGSQVADVSLVHADAVHYVWESAVEYSELLVDQVAAQFSC